MPYNTTPFNYLGTSPTQIKDDLDKANQNFKILGQAFYNNDPSSQPILRASYIGSTAPSNPVAGMTWLDTSVNPSALKVYDGSNWQSIVPLRVDLTNATSDYMLQVGEEAIINFTNATSVPLRIATQSGTYYECHLVCSNGGTSGGGNAPVYLNPNNTTYSNSFAYASLFRYLGEGNSSYDTYSAFRCGVAFVSSFFYITNFVQYKNVKGIYDIYGLRNDTPALVVFSTDWRDTTTPWTSLGTITFPQSTSGYIIVRRLV